LFYSSGLHIILEKDQLAFEEISRLSRMQYLKYLYIEVHEELRDLPFFETELEDEDDCHVAVKAAGEIRNLEKFDFIYERETRPDFCNNFFVSSYGQQYPNKHLTIGDCVYV
jgi:hypothetical protein